MAPEYVAKHFSGSMWEALRHYASETYSSMENFFRQNQSHFRDLSRGNGALEKIRQRLEHTERFSDPVIRHALLPLLEDYSERHRQPREIADEIEATKQIRDAVSELVCQSGCHEE